MEKRGAVSSLPDITVRDNQNNVGSSDLAINYERDVINQPYTGFMEWRIKELGGDLIEALFC